MVQDHTLFMILTASDMDAVQQFMGPFAQAGSVQIWEGDPRDAVVARRNCGAGGKVWVGGKIF